ncbi:glycoside hydrolase family 15 protein [Streptomyces sp. WAC08241]|nr:glycoside hydrolase family 15 protein [Streptomyces sp. WAC08241]
MAVRAGQSVWLTREALRELDADGEIALVPQKPVRRLRPAEPHPADIQLVREVRDAVLSGHHPVGAPLRVQRRGLDGRRIARVCRPLLAEGLLAHRDGPDGPRLHVAVPVPAEDGPGLIEDYALIGDQRGAALVRRTGSIDWLCLPRFDSDALFARLLGTADHGFWDLAPVHLADASAAPVPVRRYADNSMVHEIEWVTETGVVRVNDFMVPGGVEAPQVVRIVTGVQGDVPMRSLLRTRPEYGLVVPRLDRADGRHVAIDVPAAGGRLWAQATVPLQTHDELGDVHAAFTVSEGETVAFSLVWREGIDVPAPQPAPDALLQYTLDHWREWADRCTYTGDDRAEVLRSLLTLSALIYAPTGAIVAAPTTSLPEEIGGDRNWDYRASWLRDGAFAATALARCGYLGEALAWKDWVIRSCAGTPGRWRIMYRVDGTTDLREEVLAHLPGYEGSAPVRIGNGAADQLQLDVYGELADTLLEFALGVGPDATPGIAAVIVDLATELEPLWAEPDMGVWEVRGPRRHFVHSKVMAWVTFDRAVQVIERGWATGPLERWKALREAIHAEVCEKGFDPEWNIFTQSYGSRELDAALLYAMLAGFLPADDKRVIGTIEAVQRELGTESGLLLRYRTEGEHVGVDGLSGDEGHFLICTGWLAECLARIGRVDEAQDVLAALRSLRNDVGLLAEEYDPAAGRQLGNFPQAFSHLAEILAAVAIGTASVGGEHTTVTTEPAGAAP